MKSVFDDIKTNKKLACHTWEKKRDEDHLVTLNCYSCGTESSIFHSLKRFKNPVEGNKDYPFLGKFGFFFVCEKCYKERENKRI